MAISAGRAEHLELCQDYTPMWHNGQVSAFYGHDFVVGARFRFAIRAGAVAIASQYAPASLFTHAMARRVSCS